MYIAKFIKETPEEEIKCMTVEIGRVLLTFALAEMNWKTKGKERRIPIWISRKGLFIYRLAMTGKIKKVVKK